MKRKIKINSSLVVELSFELSKALGYDKTHALVQKAVETVIANQEIQLNPTTNKN